jgi:hypothetical protein
MKWSNFPSKYSTKCRFCGSEISEGNMVLGSRDERGKWVIIHPHCKEGYELKVGIGAKPVTPEDDFKDIPVEGMKTLMDATLSSLSGEIPESLMMGGFMTLIAGGDISAEKTQNVLRFEPPSGSIPRKVDSLEYFKENAAWSL